MNINYKKNGEKKAFLAKPKINIMYPNVENVIVVLNYKKNRDYYENPSLTHFTDEL